MNNSDTFRLRCLKNCDNLVFARERLGMTQTELARKADVTQVTLSQWENGRGNPSLIALTRVCDVLGTSLTRYLTGKKIRVKKPRTPFGGLSMKMCRLEHGYAISKLSELTGIAEMTLRSYENDVRSPTLYALEQICGVLKVPIDYYVGYTPKTLDSNGKA